MAYATLSHVQARNAMRQFSATSKPSTDDTIGFIHEAAAEIDFVLKHAGYSVPVYPALVSTSAQLMLQKANAVGAAYMVEVAAPSSDGRRKEYEDMWESALRMLKVFQLDIPKDASESNPRQGPVASPPFFSRDMEL